MTHDVPRRFRLHAARALAAARAVKLPSAPRPGAARRAAAAAVIVLAASFAALPATGAPDRPSELFHGAEGIGGFLHRPGTADGRPPWC